MKTGASGRDPALRGHLQMLTYPAYATLFRWPRALGGGLTLGFQLLTDVILPRDLIPPLFIRPAPVGL
jgi:hypothetical protein